MGKITLTPATKKSLTNLQPGDTIKLIKLPDGEIAVHQPPTKTQLLEKFSHLAGQGISISEAAEKYDVPKGAVRNWIYQSDYICFIDTDSYPQLIDEAEVAMCAEIYHERQKTGLTGIPYFDKDDTLITKIKHPKLSRYRQAKKAA